MRIYIVLKEDIVKFPPVQSLLRVLAELKMEVYHVGSFSDPDGKADLKKMGVNFIEAPYYDVHAGKLTKLRRQFSFKRFVKAYLGRQNLDKDDLIWLIQTETIYLLGSLAKRYNVLLHPLEFKVPKVGLRYRLLSPMINLKQVYRNASKVVCCEYNRAHITKGLFSLDTLPYILPNKPYIDERALQNVPEKIAAKVDSYCSKWRGRKAILYQGIFYSNERKLEEFCEAISLLPDDFVLVAMGSGDSSYDELKSRYEGDRIIFLPFIKPPYHLLVTQAAYIGVLSYFPLPKDYGTVINPIYCAPNKIYEYSKYGKPMISNDIPGLHYIFREYRCGECISYPITASKIADAVLKIEGDYAAYSSGALSLYESEDMVARIKGIIGL